MYRKTPDKQLAFEDFYLPFGGKLRSDNRWVVLAKMVPWDQVEAAYAEHFTDEGPGAPAKPARLALGALIVKERLGVSDAEAVEQIRENPYLQYFLGFHEFNNEAPFDSSMYVYFRKRFSLEELGGINEAIFQAEKDAQIKPAELSADDNEEPPAQGGNKGKLLIDATCAPADIRYPTDLSLLNEAREKTELIIDRLFEPLKGQQKKPRTYRQKARRQFLASIKKRNRSPKKTRKAVGQQLGFVRRNLKTIDRLCEQSSLGLLPAHFYRNLLVIRELYRQQQWMYDNRCHRISDRIVSISQPHVRPIVRGKTSAPTEFGAKISISLIDGFGFVDRLDWNAYNECGDLKDQLEQYRRRVGCYPESVHCDAIYRTRENRKFCKQHGIRMSGPALGRPPQETTENAQEIRAAKRQRRQDEIDRIPVEGKFGEGKRRYGLDRIMAKGPQTSEAVIGVIFIVMNLSKWLRKFFLCLFICLRQQNSLRLAA